jgi:Dot/Icm secretion system protein IcmQ
MQHSEARNKLLQAIDKAVQEGQWESSLFYKNMLKQLLVLRENLVTKLGDGFNEVASNEAKVVAAAAKQKDGYEKVYIGLYQSIGESLESWAATVRSLPEHAVGRPVYGVPEHIEEMVRVKNSRTEAYVVVWVKQTNILPHQLGLQLCDRFGHELLNLRAGSIQLEHIIEFVHDGKKYALINNQLLPQG